MYSRFPLKTEEYDAATAALVRQDQAQHIDVLRANHLGKDCPVVDFKPGLHKRQNGYCKEHGGRGTVHESGLSVDDPALLKVYEERNQLRRQKRQGGETHIDGQRQQRKKSATSTTPGNDEYTMRSEAYTAKLCHYHIPDGRLCFKPYDGIRAPKRQLCAEHRRQVEGGQAGVIISKGDNEKATFRSNQNHKKTESGVPQSLLKRSKENSENKDTEHLPKHRIDDKQHKKHVESRQQPATTTSEGQGKSKYIDDARLTAQELLSAQHRSDEDDRRTQKRRADFTPINRANKNGSQGPPAQSNRSHSIQQFKTTQLPVQPAMYEALRSPERQLSFTAWIKTRPEDTANVKGMCQMFFV